MGNCKGYNICTSGENPTVVAPGRDGELQTGDITAPPGESPGDPRSATSVNSGPPPGHVTESYEDGTKYVGMKSDNMKNGQGTLLFETGLVKYKGNWAEDEFEGTGLEFNETVGDYRAAFAFLDLAELFSKNLWVKYEGGFTAGQWNGEGVVTFSNGERLEIVCQMGSFHGAGKVHRTNGETWEGQWLSDKLQILRFCKADFLSEVYSDGSSYSGQHETLVKHGAGKSFFPNGALSYEG
jgi:hypothetical protein